MQCSHLRISTSAVAQPGHTPLLNPGPAHVWQTACSAPAMPLALVELFTCSQGEMQAHQCDLRQGCRGSCNAEFGLVLTLPLMIGHAHLPKHNQAQCPPMKSRSKPQHTYGWEEAALKLLHARAECFAPQHNPQPVDRCKLHPAKTMPIQNMHMCHVTVTHWVKPWGPQCSICMLEHFPHPKCNACAQHHSCAP